MLCLMVRLGAEALVLNDRARSAMSASERESRKAAFAKMLVLALVDALCSQLMS
jgi:hypothetical protein